MCRIIFFLLFLCFNREIHSFIRNDNNLPKLAFKDNLKNSFNELKALGKNKNGGKSRNEIFSGKNRRRDSSSSSSSTSDETMDWKEEWKEKWKNIKQIATEYNISNADKGDRVNMVAARPWGVPCGDPNQHDVPWGSCVLPMECESEYRIYRGDQFCGRTEFVCCSILLNTYDMYHGLLDVSLSDSSLETDSAELKEKKKENKHGKWKRKRKKMRHKRKKAIKKLIKKTVKDISKILNRTYRFGTKARVKKTKQLKKFVKELKKKYKKDRQTMQDIHELELHHIDKTLNKGIKEIRELNRNLVYNNTIHRWIVNGTLSKYDLMFLRDNHPDIWKDIKPRKNRRFNSENKEYDVEYGLLYV